MITLTCEQCGKRYEAKPYMADLSEHHFCGLECYGQWQRVNRIGVGRKRVTVKCVTCGKDIEKQPNAVHEFNFCSRACFGLWRRSDYWLGPNSPAWRGGHADSRGSNWSHQRHAAIERDNNTCQHCGHIAPNLQVHHIRPFRLFSDYRDANDLANLITLCPTCHGKAEQAFWKSHPELIDLSPFPIPVPEKACRACGKVFAPRSGATAVCDECCTAVCAHCGNAFYSRKASFRVVKYCSRECRNAAVKRNRT